MSDEVTEFAPKLNPLPAETKWEAQEKRRQRQAFSSTFSEFVKAMREAITEYLSFRKQGMSRADAIKGLEMVLRDTWPKHVSKFRANCDACDDTGYQELVCEPTARCLRPACQRKGEAFQHRYVRFCFCEKGAQFERRSEKQPPAEEINIGKVRKQPSWKRLGV